MPVVVASAWYSDTANWKKVIINYRSTSDNEMLTVNFDATQVSPTGSLLVISPSKDVFEAISMTIVDFNNGSFRVPSTSLSQGEFDVNFDAPLSFFTRNFSSPSTFQSYESSTQPYYNTTRETSSIVSNVLLFIMDGGAEFIANPIGIEFTEGVQYKFRVYVSAASQVPLSLQFQLSETPQEAHSFSEAQISAARGSFIEYSFTATASQVTTNPFIRLTKNGGNATLSVDKIEILEL